MCKEKQWFLVGLLFVLTLMLIGWNGQAQSQEKYPTRAINIIVPFTPGGGTDLVTRFIATYLNKKWLVPVNVVNKPGGNTVPACVEVFNSAADGYTILNDNQSSSSVLGVIVKDLSTQIMARTFIAVVSLGPQVFVVPSTSPYRSLEDVIAEAKRDPENFTWASGGGASGPDFFTRQLFKAIGVDVSKTKPVMVKGGAEYTALAAGGHVKLAGTSLTSARAPVKAGLIRLLAVARERNPEFPDVPTPTELGYPTVNCVYWAGYSGPPNMPSYIVDIWNKAIQEIVKDPEYISKVANIGYKAFYLNSREMKEYIIKEMEEVAELYGIKR